VYDAPEYVEDVLSDPRASLGPSMRELVVNMALRHDMRELVENLLA